MWPPSSGGPHLNADGADGLNTCSDKYERCQKTGLRPLEQDGQEMDDGRTQRKEGSPVEESPPLDTMGEESREPIRGSAIRDCYCFDTHYGSPFLFPLQQGDRCCIELFFHLLFPVIIHTTNFVAGTYAVISMADKCPQSISILCQKSVPRSVWMRYFWDNFALTYAYRPGLFSRYKRGAVRTNELSGEREW